MYFDEKITHSVQISSPHVGSFQNEALKKKTEAPSTQISKTKHPKLENEDP